MNTRKFKIGDRVERINGSQFRGVPVGAQGTVKSYIHHHPMSDVVVEWDNHREVCSNSIHNLKLISAVGFKVGDRVERIMCSFMANGFTARPGMIGTVVGEGTNSVRVDWDGHPPTHEHTRYDPQYLRLIPKEVVPVPEQQTLKIGDRVKRVKCDNGDQARVGEVGTIVGTSATGLWLVEYDNRPLRDRVGNFSDCLELVPDIAQPEQGGRKDDDGKIRTDLFSVQAYLGTCQVLTFGAKKYAAWNWSKGIMFMRVYGAILRHLLAWGAGEENDKETGLSHLDHAACELMFLQHFTKCKGYTGFDDRKLFRF